MKKIIFILFLLFPFFICATTEREMTILDVKDFIKSGDNVVMSTTGATLSQEFKENEYLFKKTYQKKPIRIFGLVDDISFDYNNNPFIYIKGDGFISSVRLDMKNDDDLLKIKLNDGVDFVCQYKGKYGFDPYFNSCIFTRDFIDGEFNKAVKDIDTYKNGKPKSIAEFWLLVNKLIIKNSDGLFKENMGPEEITELKNKAITDKGIVNTYKSAQEKALKEISEKYQINVSDYLRELPLSKHN